MNDLLKQLIAGAGTEKNGERRNAQTLAAFFKTHGIAAELDTWDENRANLVAVLGRDEPDLPTLVIGVHLDVVPASPEHWDSAPFGAPATCWAASALRPERWPRSPPRTLR